MTTWQEMWKTPRMTSKCKSLVDYLYDASSFDTCYPQVSSNWSANNKSWGHCALYALYINRVSGGELLSVDAVTSDGSIIPHIYNQIMGQEFDYSISQFKQGTKFINKRLVSIDEILKGTKNRFKVFSRRMLDHYLQNAQLGVDSVTLRAKWYLNHPIPVVLTSENLNLITRISTTLLDQQKPYQGLSEPLEISNVSELDFTEVDEATAEIIHKYFHYIGHYRPVKHFALSKNNKIVCLGSIDKCDLAYLKGILPNSIVFTRFFAFRWAPRNCFSYFCSKLIKHLKYHGTETLISFVNPNLGFSGSAYNKEQWKLIAFEHGTQYTYINNTYTTVTELVTKYGTSDIDILKYKLGVAVRQSEVLEPLHLYAYPFTIKSQKLIPNEPLIIHRQVIKLSS